MGRVSQFGTITKGETTKRIAIGLDDQEVEGVEYVLVQMSDPSPGTVILDGQRRALDIGDNDHSPHFYLREVVEKQFPLVLLGNEGASHEEPLPRGAWLLRGSDVVSEAHLHPAGGWLLRFWGDDTPVLVNGVAQHGLARLDAQGEIDTAFRFAPPDDVSIWDGWTLGLRSGGAVFEYLAIDRALNREMPVLRFLRADGSYDPKFPKVALAEQDRVLGLGETSNGTVTILVRHTRQVNGFDKSTSELIRITAQGERLPGVPLPESRGYGQTVFVADGGFLIEGVTGDENEPWRAFTWRFLADGTLDPVFKPIEGSPALALQDGRIVISRSGADRSDVRLIYPNGELDSTFQRTVLAGCSESTPLKILGLVNGRLWILFGCGSPQDNHRQQLGEIILTSPPATALAPAIHLSKKPEGGVFSIPLVRLGKNSASATVRYTTRDLTATAGKDYVAQSGTLTFAPLETEKTIQIPILADTEDEFHETLEVVVTAAEGFEALPAPMRLTILGKGPAPRLERVKRLRDGRVLLGGTGPQGATRLEYSTDLQTWHPPTNLLGGFNGESAVWLDASGTNAPARYYRTVAR